MNNLLMGTGIIGAAYGGVLCVAGAIGLWTPCPSNYICSELQSKATSTLLVGGAVLGNGAALFAIGAERDRKNWTKI